MSRSSAPAPSSPLDQTPDQRSPSIIIVVLALAGISVALMQTMVIPIVPNLPSLLGATPANAAWAITVTLLAGAVATPLAGRLGDMIGKRPVMLASLALMVTGSAICALSDSLVPMIIGRAVQGLSIGVIPVGISLMRDLVPADRLGSAVAVMSASLGVGGAMGLPVAALIAQSLDWHILFWVAAGLGGVVFGLVAALVPASPNRTGGRLDIAGTIGLSATLLCLLLAISKGADWGWTSGITLGLVVAAIGIGLAWGAWELRVPQPLVDLRITARRQVLVTNLASLMFGFSLFAMSLVIPQVIQLPVETGYGLGQSMLTAGLTLAPNGLVMMVMAIVSARMTTRYGPKVTLMTGALVVAVGYGLGSVLMGSIWQLAMVSGVIGAGIGLGYGAMPALIMAAVPVSETAAANSFNTLVRSIGTSASSAVAGAVLAGSAVAVGATSAPSEDGFRLVMVIAAGTSVAALAIAAFLPPAMRRADDPVAVRAVDGDEPAAIPARATRRLRAGAG